MDERAEIIERSLPARLAVVAAHPDDDVIGCGGTMAAVARCGGSVDVTFLTDGSRSHPGSTRFPPERVATLREAEARAALEILGVREPPVFLGICDGTLGRLSANDRADAVARLAERFRATRPEVVFLPWRRDPHPDHVAAYEIGIEALGESRAEAAVAEYEVWLPIRGTEDDRPQEGETRIRDVALDFETQARKRSALLAHRTQTSEMIDDDPSGFRIDETHMRSWIAPFERFHEGAVAARSVGYQ